MANQILARTFFRFRRDFVCVPSRWKVLSGEFRRRPTSLAVKLRISDRVGRRGLFEPREDFSRLPTYAIPLLIPRQLAIKTSLTIQPYAKPSSLRSLLETRLD